MHRSECRVALKHVTYLAYLLYKSLLAHKTWLVLNVLREKWVNLELLSIDLVAGRIKYWAALKLYGPVNTFKRIFLECFIDFCQIIKRFIKCWTLRLLQFLLAIFSKTLTTAMFQMHRSSRMLIKLPTTQMEQAGTRTSTGMPVDFTLLTYRHLVWEFHHLIREEYRQ